MEAALGHRGIDRAAGQRAEGQTTLSVDGDDARCRAIEGGGVARGVLREDQAGIDDRQRVVEAREVAGQRVVGRDRCDQSAGTQGAEDEQRVLEAVVGEDGDGLAVGTEALRDQP